MSQDMFNPYAKFENFNDKWEECTLCSVKWPHNELIRRDGRLYCNEHYIFRFEKRDREKWVPRYKDDQKKPI